MTRFAIFDNLKQIPRTQGVHLDCIVEIVRNEAFVHAGQMDDEVELVFVEDPLESGQIGDVTGQQGKVDLFCKCARVLGQYEGFITCLAQVTCDPGTQISQSAGDQ